jgi:peptidyl-prolyl cis-trans isomerase SurA
MKKIGIILSMLNVVSFNTYAQKSKVPVKQLVKPAPAPVNPWVFSYGQDTVYKKEFERLLSKNRNEKEAPTEADVREYLDLYQNFKMKVKEAHLMQLDTLNSFKTELAGYRKQLANPYLTDKKVSEALIKEAYDRMKEEVNASHILINCAENAMPKDTLEAYNKLMEIRKRILKGESFDSLALQFSQDPSAQKNMGLLGWFTAFHMIYPFENQAYKTPKGQVSLPFRTRYGYHLIKVNDRRSARGEVRVAHIMIQTGPSASDETKIEARLKADTVYMKLQKGESFESLVAAYSADQSSKANGGLMNWFSSFSNFPDEFKAVAFSLSKGEYSRPFKTDYGYHIIKLADKRPVAELKELEENIKSKIGRDSRAESSRLVVAQRIKKESKYMEHVAVLKEFIAGIDSSFLKGTWTPDESKINDKSIVTINAKSFTVRQFADFVKLMQEPREKESISMIVNGLFKKFTDEKALEYEESVLEEKYEDFRNLMQEYHDGILLFDLTDKKVWTKAVTDTAGLQQFYEANKAKYMWKDRVLVHTYNCLNEKAKKEAMKMAAAGKTGDEIKTKLNKKLVGTVIITESKHEKGENPEKDKLWDKKGVVDAPNEGGAFKFYVVSGIITPEPKALKEARGVVTSDYQNQLEKDWIQSLRSKYPVIVNEEVVKTLFK